MAGRAGLEVADTTTGSLSMDWRALDNNRRCVANAAEINEYSRKPSVVPFGVCGEGTARQGRS